MSADRNVELVVHGGHLLLGISQFFHQLVVPGLFVGK